MNTDLAQLPHYPALEAPTKPTANPIAADHPVGLAYLDGLRGVCRGRLVVDGEVAKGFFTSFRWLELAVESDGSRSAWAVAPMSVAGRTVETAVLVGDLRSPQELVRIIGRARASVAEVIVGGSRAATLLGEGTLKTTTDRSFAHDGSEVITRRRVFLYALPSIDRSHAETRLAAFVDRNGIKLVGDESVKAPRKRTAKAA